MRSQQISSRVSLLVSLLLLVNLSVFMGSTIPVHASSQNNTVAKMQSDLSFQKDLDVLSGHPEKSDSSSDSSDDDYFGLHNDNIPEPTNPCYREYDLTNETQATISFVHGSKTEGNMINLPHLTDNDLSKLVINDGITIDQNSKLQQNDLKEFKYDSVNRILTVTLTPDALVKTNGAGTQLRLNLKSQDGKRSNQAVIGLWRNYVEHPHFELDIGNNLYLQYMLNNDSDYHSPKPSTELQTATPNYRIRDSRYSKEGTLVDTMFSGYNISSWRYDSLFIKNGTSSGLQLQPKNHIYVGTDPKNPGKIIFQFDTTLPNWYSGSTPRIRVMGCLEPAKNGQEVITKQKLINYSPKDSYGRDVYFSNIKFYRDYDTDLNGNDHIPIYIGNIDPVSRKPKGIYFKDTNPSNPYRLDFLFDKSDSFPEFGAFYFGNIMNDSYNVNTIGHHSDECIFSGGDSAIGMLKPFKTKPDETWEFGESTPTMSYGTASGLANEPVVRVNSPKSPCKYVHDLDKENSLPELPLKGTVNSTNTKCSEVKLYYLIDQNKIPKDPTQGNYLTKVNTNQHNIDSWEPFQVGINNNDLKTLATPSKKGHTIYIYGVDFSGKYPLKSNLVPIEVLPNIKIPLHYSYNKNSGETETADDYLLGAATDKYDLNDVNDSHYLPRVINRNGINYQLDKNNSSSLAGIFNESTAENGINENGINIVYQEIESMLIMHAPKLDFGDVLLPTHKKLIPIKKQNNSNDQLEIIDINTGTPTWKLTMAATPFYRVDPHSGKEIKDDKDKLENLLTYQYANKDALVLKSSPQEIRRYSDAEVQNASTREGRQTTTDFQKIWWNPKEKQKQIEGPMLQPPKNYSFKNKAHQVKYHSTVTWTLSNCP